jgi:hypothetical protein
MKILIKGSNKKIKYSEVRQATRFMSAILMPKRLLNKIELDIEFEVVPGCKGTTEYIDTNDRPRMFKVTINPNMSKRNQLLTLAHELVHVKQYARGEMKEFLNKEPAAMKWGKDIYYHEQHDYFELPWEIEAYGREVGLYSRYIEHKNVRNRNKS